MLITGALSPSPVLSWLSTLWKNIFPCCRMPEPCHELCNFSSWGLGSLTVHTHMGASSVVYTSRAPSLSDTRTHPGAGTGPEVPEQAQPGCSHPSRHKCMSTCLVPSSCPLLKQQVTNSAASRFSPGTQDSCEGAVWQGLCASPCAL